MLFCGTLDDKEYGELDSLGFWLYASPDDDDDDLELVDCACGSPWWLSSGGGGCVL